MEGSIYVIMEKIVLNKVISEKNIVKFVFSVSDNLKKYFTTDTFFIEYEEDISEVPISILTIPFVNCMAGLSWLSGAMLFVDEIDATYYESFKQLKRAYSELHNTQLKGMFVPSVFVKNEIRKTDDYLLLFGGGVDCHSSYLRNKKCVVGVINIYGWLNDQNDISNVDEADKRSTKQFAQEFGVKDFHVRSNFVSQFNNKLIDQVFCKQLNTSLWYGFLHSMAFLSISTPIAWISGISNLMISSSFTKGRAGVHCGSFITTDSEFKFAQNGKTLQDGFELDRQDKIKILVDYQRETNKPYFIQACSFNDHNCCECGKCLRTIYELVAEGVDPRNFGFDRIQGSLREYIESLLTRNIYLINISAESYYIDVSKQRMRQNYENIQEKEFVDWFLNFDFEKAKRIGLYRHYTRDFFSIIKRKLFKSNKK